MHAGFDNLDLSKIVMYDFHYNFVKSMYGDNAKLCNEITTNDLYADMKEHAQLYDFNNYNSTRPHDSKTNAKVPAKCKDELGGYVVKEFIGLSPKMYSLLYDGREKQTT